MRIAACIALIGLAACASQTVINSNPPGAELLVDGRLVGITPAVYTDSSTWNWSGHLVTLRRPGFATFTAPIAASDVNVGRLVVGSLLLWPMLFSVSSYPDRYDFPLTPLPSAAATQAPPPPAPPKPL